MMSQSNQQPYATGIMNEQQLAVLENEYCVITYDTENNRFDLNAEAHGKQEYTICVMKKMTLLRGYDPIEEERPDIRIDGVFSMIFTKFPKKIVQATEIFDFTIQI